VKAGVMFTTFIISGVRRLVVNCAYDNVLCRRSGAATDTV